MRNPSRALMAPSELWLNMGEMFFGIITRQAICRGTCTSVKVAWRPTGRIAVLRRQAQSSQMQSPRVKHRSLRAGARRSGLSSAACSGSRNAMGQRPC